MNDKNTCTYCKYFHVCGDVDRVEPCSGFINFADREETKTEDKKTMKTYKQIKKEMQKTRNEIEALEAELAAIERKDERRAEYKAGNIDRLKAIAEEMRANHDKITAICDKIYLLKIALYVMRDSYKAAVINEALPIIAEATAKYNGKQYGKKTEEKIREEVKNRGFWFYFKGYSKQTDIVIREYREGCYHMDDCDAYTGYDNPFVTSDNRLDFDPAKVKHNYKYAENPKKAAREIIKAYDVYKKETAKAYKAQSAFNDLLPESISNQHNVTREPYATMF